MTSAALDRLLALLIAALVTTGLVSLRLGAEGEAWVFAVHGMLAAALAVTVTMKLARSLPKAIRARRWRRVVLASLLSLATIGALVGGFAWVASGRLLTVGAWTVLTLHAWIGLVLIPITLVHLLPRRWRLLVPRERSTPRPRSGPPMTRRSLLTAGVLGAATLALFGVTQLADTIAGGARRFTGSRWLPSGGLPPDTTFFGEPAPAVDTAAWRVVVRDATGGTSTLSIADLRQLGEIDRTVVLDCTSGWALETTWRGIPLAAVLGHAGVPVATRSVTVRSATGWSASLGPDEVDRALLATGVAGGPLPVPNGAPCRLVIPDRRGLDWVKWVAEIEVV
jgi:molybdopterin-dependent oxidoreductase-like protein protein